MLEGVWGVEDEPGEVSTSLSEPSRQDACINKTSVTVLLLDTTEGRAAPAELLLKAPRGT